MEREPDKPTHQLALQVIGQGKAGWISVDHVTNLPRLETFHGLCVLCWKILFVIITRYYKKDTLMSLARFNSN